MGEPFAGDGEIGFIDLESGEGSEPEIPRCEGRGADAEEGVHQMSRFVKSMKRYALLYEADGEGSGMRAFLFTGLDGVVGEEPGVSAAALVDAVGRLPTGDVLLIGVGHACGAAVEGDRAGFGQVEKVFVAVVDKALGLDGLEVA